MELNKNQDNKPKTKQERKERKMKKILTVSLFAIMAVGAANADIASTEFVKGQTGSIEAFKAGDFTGVASAATNLKGAVDAITGSLGAVENGKTVVDMIEAAQADATYDDAEVRGLIGDNADAITAIETSAYATSGATKAKIDAIATNTTNIGKNTDAIAAINNETTGILAQAKKHTDDELATLSGNVAAFESALGGKQDKSAAADGDYVLGGQNGAWQSIKALPEYCGSGHCALVSNDGNIEWEKVE